jgi:hypothetical protein
VVNWIQGRDLAAVNLAPAFTLPSPSEGGDLQTIQLSTGDGDKLPTNDFYMFFPGSTTASPVELPEYVYIATRAADTLLCGPDPFGVSPTTGRAAINPTRWPAVHHPVLARLELRNVFEIYKQLQDRLDAHVHDGTTANGPVLTQAQGTNTVSIVNNTIYTLTVGDVVAYSNGQAISVPSTGYLGLPIAVVCSPAGGPPTGGGDYSATPGASVYVRPAGVAWAKCTSTVTAGAPIQTTNAKTVTNLVSPAIGAIGFALTTATAYSDGYYCQILLINRGSDILTPLGVQDIKNKTLFSPVLYSSADATARMSFPTLTANDTLVGVNTAATLLAKTLTSPAINGGTISGATITATNAALTTPTITGGVISGVALGATGAILTAPAITGGTHSGGTFTSPTINTPAVTGGTFTSPTINTPAITGGTHSGGTFTSPTINTPALTGGTYSGGTLTAPAINFPTVTGGAYASPAISSPSLSGNIFYTNASTAIIPGTAYWGSTDHTGGAFRFVVYDNGLVEMRNQGFVHAYYSLGAYTLPNDGSASTLVANAEIFDRLGEHNPGTGVFSPSTTGVYQFNISVEYQVVNPGVPYAQIIGLDLSSWYQTIELYRYNTDTTTASNIVNTVSASHAVMCPAGSSAYFSMWNIGNISHPVQILTFYITIARLA